jgi:dTDP-4-dehydrorhamnose 3,5-epimerase
LNGNTIAQINRTFTAKRGTVRGMHLQYSPHAETKFVSCLRGEVFDVAIDLRSGSSTFLQWHAQILSADNHMTMMIPEGFAHGLQTLSDDCELLYLHTAAFHPEAEGGFNAQDPLFAIRWPLAITEQSARDTALGMLAHGFTGVV